MIEYFVFRDTSPDVTVLHVVLYFSFYFVYLFIFNMEIFNDVETMCVIFEQHEEHERKKQKQNKEKKRQSS